MIHYKKGDLLQSDGQALVNTVNTAGVMGKGIAFQFREAFPLNNKIYIEACKRKELAPGKLLAVWDENLRLGKKLIVNFPTKVHWRHPSKYEYIEKGLVALPDILKKAKIKSVAIPPLGCGNGGLHWKKVKPMIEQALSGLDMEIYLFKPTTTIKGVLQQQKAKNDVHLTPARASLLYALFAFESMGEYSTLFTANKLAYFLQRTGQHLRLQFKPHHYGPYSIGVEKVLYHLNGTYLKGMEQVPTKPFKALQLNYGKWEEVNKYINHKLADSDANPLRNLVQFLSGYSSELSLELLATIDFILAENSNYSVHEAMTTISKWNMQKTELFKNEHIEKAYYHIKSHSQTIFPAA